MNKLFCVKTTVKLIQNKGIIKMNISLLRNFFEKFSVNVGGRKNSNGNDNKVEGNNNNIVNATINYYSLEKENNIELSEQALRIYKVFNESGYYELSVMFDNEVLMVENNKESLSIDGLDKRMVKADIDNLVKCGYLKFDREQKNIAVFYTLAK